MYPQLAAQIRKQLPAFVDQYDAQLRHVPGYAGVPEPARRDLEQQVLQIMADCLEGGDDSALIQYIHERAEQVLARGFQPEWFQQAVTLAEEIITPLIKKVDEGNFVWRAMNHAQTTAWQIVARERTQVEEALRHSTEQQQHTARQLRAALEATNELIQVQDLDTLYRRTVELVREKFGIERCGLYLTDESHQYLLGTYGTDDHRHTTDERGAQRTTAEFEVILTTSPEQLWVVRETPHVFFENGVEHTLGAGWVVGTVLRGAAGPIGILFNDNALSGQPVDEAQQEALAVYCSAVGSIIERKRTEQELKSNFQMQQLLSTLLTISLENLPLLEQLERALDTITTSPFLPIKPQSGIFLVEQNNVLTLKVSHNLAPQLLSLCALVPFGRCLCGRAAATGQIQFADCVDERHENQFEGMRPHGHYNVPILSQGKLLGVMVLYVQEGHRPEKREEEYLRAVANTLAGIIERKQLEQRIRESLERRSRQVQTSTEVAQEIASATDLKELFQRVVTLIKERFDYYHAQLFRYEPAQGAVVLITGYGEIGQKMLASGHKLPMGRGVAGTAAATGESILVADVHQDKDWQPNPNLPETRGELAVPIKLRDQVLGILDVQSDRAGALTDDDRLLLEGLCGQIAVALESTRLLEELRRGEAQLSEALKIAKLAYWEYDVEKDLFLFNDQFYALFHTTAEQEGGYQLSSAQYAGKFVYPDDLPVVGVEIERALNSTDRHYSRDLVHRIQYADGGVGYISVSINIDRDEQGRILRYYGANQDITESRLAEQTIKEEQQRTQTILETVTVPMIISRLSDSKILYANQALAQFRHLAVEEMIGSRTADYFVNPDDRRKIVEALQQQGYVIDFETQLLGSDGAPSWVLLSARIVKYQNDTSVLTTYIDITDRKLAEEVLRRSEAQLSEALKIAKLAYWEYDVEKDLFLFNEQFYSIFHTTVEQEGGYQLSSAQYAGKFVYPDDLPVVGSEIERALNSTDQHYSRDLVHRIQYADGGVGYISVSINIDRDEQGRILRYYGANQDITQNKQAEIELAKFKLGLDRSTAAIFITDPEGIITYINPAFEKIYGFTRVEALGHTPRILKSGLIPQEQYQQFWQALLAGQTVAGEIVNKAKDGRLVPVEGSNSSILDEKGNLIGFLALHTDITRRKEVEQELAHSAQLLNTIANTSRDLIYVKNTKGEFQIASQAVARLVGAKTGDELIGKSDFDFFPYELANKYYTDEQNIIQAGEPLIDIEEASVYPDGTPVWLLTTKIPYRAADGTLLGLVGIGRDITERKRAEQQMEETLRETERLYAAVSAEGWKTFRQSGRLPEGYLYDRALLQPAEQLWEPEIEQAVTQDKTVATQSKERAVAVTPLAVRGEIIGALGIYGSPDKPLSPDDLSLVEAASEQVALALESARLFGQMQAARQQAESHLREVQILQHLTQEISGTLDLERVLDALVSTLVNQMHFGFVAFILIDEPANEMRTVRVAGLAQSMNGLVQPLDKMQNDIDMDVARKGKIEVIDGWDDRFDREIFEREGHAALVRAFVPLRLREQTVGVLEAGYRRGERSAITPEEIRLLGSLADQVAVVIQNTRLFEQTQTRARHEKTLREVTARVRSSTDPDTVMRTLARELGAVLDRSTFVRLTTEQPVLTSANGGNGNQPTTEGGR